jgi:glycosyltransferase involved in cell wall biosynthesis
MKVAVLSPVWFPVPPSGYGGIEWVVSLLTDGLVDAGHDVTLFASGDSRTKAELVCVYEVAPSTLIGTAQVEIHHALACFERADSFDVISDHSGPPAAVVAGAVSTPTVHTVHGPLVGEAGEVYAQIARVAPRTRLVSLSLNQRASRPDLPWLANIPNALDFDLYPAHPHKGDYLFFLGRMNQEKGAHRAVALAIELGLPLKLAGKKREPAEQAYFRELVEPHLREGMIEYVGEVSHGQKVELLQNARVTLFPIDWEEPFGLVMIESMACGTPVIATRRGSVPEVLEHGRSGLIVDDWRDAAAALDEVDRLAPLDVRHAAERRFSRDRMVADYVDAFDRAITGAG